MTVLPGSLDYLYYQGILDHIPYEVYDLPYAAPMNESVNPQISGSQLKQMIAGSVNNEAAGNRRVNNYGMGVNAGVNNAGRNNFAMNRSSMYGNSYNSSMNGSQYIDYAKQGAIYGSYGSGDSFVRGGNDYVNNPAALGNTSGLGSVYDLKAEALGENTNTKKGLFCDKKKSKDPVLGSSSWKGLLAGALIVLTPILLFKRVFKRKP